MPYYDLIRTITSELTAGQSNTVYTIPANHSFVCFIKQASGSSGSVQLADNYGAHVTISAGAKDDVKEIFEGGTNGITISATPSTSGLSITLKGILFDNTGAPIRIESSSNSASSSDSAIYENLWENPNLQITYTINGNTNSLTKQSTNYNGKPWWCANNYGYENPMDVAYNVLYYVSNNWYTGWMFSPDVNAETAQDIQFLIGSETYEVQTPGDSYNVVITMSLNGGDNSNSDTPSSSATLVGYLNNNNEGENYPLYQMSGGWRRVEGPGGGWVQDVNYPWYSTDSTLSDPYSGFPTGHYIVVCTDGTEMGAATVEYNVIASDGTSWYNNTNPMLAEGLYSGGWEVEFN